jgi:hypothetical protein
VQHTAKLSTGAVVVAALFATGVWIHRVRTPPRRIPSSNYFDQLVPPGSEPTVLMFVDSQCAPCAASVDLYRELSDRPPSAVRLAVISLESREVTTAQLQEWRLRPSIVIRIPRGEWAIRTPTLVLLDANRMVRLSIERALQIADYATVIDKLGRTNSGSGGD